MGTRHWRRGNRARGAESGGTRHWRRGNRAGGTAPGATRRLLGVAVVAGILLAGWLVAEPVDAQSGNYNELASTGVNGQATYQVSGRRTAISADGRFVALTYGGDDLVQGDTNHDSDVFVRDMLLGTTELVSLGTNGRQGSGATLEAMSADGRFVAFSTDDPSFEQAPVGSDRNSAEDVFVRDRLLRTTVRVSKVRDATGTFVEGNGDSLTASISDDGRRVAFLTDATNLDPLGPDTNNAPDLMVVDVVSGFGERASVDLTGGQFANGIEAPRPGLDEWSTIALSGDGAWVSFQTSTGSVPPYGLPSKVYLWERKVGGRTYLVHTERTGGLPLTYLPDLDHDGDSLSFTSLAAIDPTDSYPIPTYDLYVAQNSPYNPSFRWVSADRRIRLDALDPGTISSSGTRVAFTGRPFTRLDNQVFVADLTAGSPPPVTLVTSSVTTGGATAGLGTVDLHPSISGDGNYVSFNSPHQDLVAGDRRRGAGNERDVFVWGPPRFIRVDDTFPPRCDRKEHWLTGEILPCWW